MDLALYSYAARCSLVNPAAAFLPLTDDQKVDARALHGWLGIGKDFSTWVRKIIADYGFEEGSDYSPILGNRSDGRAGKPRKDYLLSLDVAKEIAMIGNTPKGKATRRYFIAAEKAAAKMASGQFEEEGDERHPVAPGHCFETLPHGLLARAASIASPDFL